MVEELQDTGQMTRRRWLPALLIAVIFAAALLAIYRFSGSRIFAEFGDREVVGTVEGVVITRERFEEEVRLSEVKYELNNQPDREVNRPELLNRMIGDYLLIHGANEAGIQVEDREVQGEIDSILGRFGVTRAEMDRVLSEHTLRWRVFENSVWEYLMLTHFVDDVLLKDVPFGEREARLEAWMATRYNEAELDFDQAFLDEVNSRQESSELQ